MSKISINKRNYSKSIGYLIALKLVYTFKIGFIKISVTLFSRDIQLIWNNSPRKNGKKTRKKE